jgi:DNA-directed RNA polymerase specialized sigma24 family protein
VIVLRSFDELTFGEIGARLGKSADACRMLFRRAMTALTSELEGDAGCLRV